MEESIITSRVEEWLSNPNISLESKSEVKELRENKNFKELKERFFKDLNFGTGGLRAIMGEGTNRLNFYTVSKAALAMSLYAKKYYSQQNFSQDFQEPLKVCLSFDTRLNSQKFAHRCVQVFAACGFECFIFENPRPVSFLSFAIRYYKAHIGVMITASHNPKKYNGFKAYWGDGKQVTYPHDEKIIEEFNAITPLQIIPLLSLEEAKAKGRFSFCSQEVEEQFYEKTLALLPQRTNFLNKGSLLKVVYTPIHGAALIPVVELLKRQGITPWIVEDQKTPDGTFPTVEYPNPEEPSAMKMAEELLKEKDADVAFGSDPDGDRIGVIVREDNEDRSPRYLNGHEIGTLLTFYLLDQRKKQKKNSSKDFVVNSIVTTDIHRKICEDFGVVHRSTLTGFKWICEEMNNLLKERSDSHFVFATEESFGYLFSPFVRDKDGIGPIALFCEMLLSFKIENKTPLQVLKEIYHRYGYHQEYLLNFEFSGIEGSKKIHSIMSHFRFKIVEVFSDQKVREKKDWMPENDILAFKLEDGSWIYLRPSGTEPKIKFYLLLVSNSEDFENKKRNLSNFIENQISLL